MEKPGKINKKPAGVGGPGPSSGTLSKNRLYAGQVDRVLAEVET